MLVESYSPRTWRTHPLHICPPEPYNPESLWNNFILDWIFLISSLNFSFWSEREGRPDRYGVEWRADWFSNKRKVHTGYWSLVAALNRGITHLSFSFYEFESQTRDCSTGREYTNYGSKFLFIRNFVPRQLDHEHLSSGGSIIGTHPAFARAYSYYARKWTHSMSCTSLSLHSTSDTKHPGPSAELWWIFQRLFVPVSQKVSQ